MPRDKSQRAISMISDLGRAKARRPGRPASRRAEEVGNSTVLIGVNLLKTIATSPAPETLTQISNRVALSISRTSRYLKSLCRAGFLEYSEETGTYVIGSSAIQLGLASLSNMDAFKTAAESMSRLTLATGLASTLSVWGTNGPTVVRSTDATLRISVRARIGVNLPLPVTAVGRIFLAFMPPEEVQPILERDLTKWNAAVPKSKRITRTSVAKIRESVRRHRIASAVGLHNPSVAALAAPAFSENGKLRMCLALTGIIGTFDSSLSGEPARRLIREAERLSRHLAVT
jgi:DNA-binding IclR family transcriptional regulator